MNLKTSTLENNFIEKISSVCSIDAKTVREVLKSMLMTFSIEFHGENYEICIPYICKLTASPYEKATKEGIKFNIDLKAEPCESLIKELKEINEGNVAPTEMYLKKRIYSKLLEKTNK